MTLCTRKNLLEVQVDDIDVTALIDTGAHMSIMSSELRRRLRKVLTPPTSRVVRVADGSTPTVAGMCAARVTIAGRQTVVLFTVLDQCSHDVILGLDFLADHSALIDCSAGVLRLELPSYQGHEDVRRQHLCSSTDVRLPPLATTLVSLQLSPLVPDGDYLASPLVDVLFARNVMTPHAVVTILDGRVQLPFTNFGYTPQVIPKGMSLATLCTISQCEVNALADVTGLDCQRDAKPTAPLPLDLEPMIASDLPTVHAMQLRDLLSSFKDIFDLDDRPLGQATAVQHRIHTGDANPVRRRPYRVSMTERQTIQAEVDKMLRKDIIEPSTSPWASPVILVRKKDGTWRFCVDYRHLNKVTTKDVYPLPRIDDALDCLHGAKYFSSIDLRTGYWQIAVDELDREKTAFVTPDGLYQFKVMPFGLCNAPATFERMMDSLLHGFKWSTCLCYLDDVIVFSPTFESHLERLAAILDVFRRAGLQLNSKKCRFGRREITVLGHLVDAAGVRPDPDKVRAVKDFPQPRSPKDVRSFIGLCSYFRRFIRNFATIAQPLTDLLRKNATFSWGSEQREALKTLTNLLTASPILGHFDPAAPTEVRTDASGHGIGAVLAQRQASGDRVIAYASRLLSSSERNYAITERECLALVWAVGKFRPYLYGRPFTVVTDHHALCWLSSLKDPTGRLGRWALTLQEYCFTVSYKSGRTHRDADCLSRHPVDPPGSSAHDSDACVLAISDLIHIGDEQRRDETIRAIIDNLRSSAHDPSLQAYLLQDGVLYRRNFRPDGPALLLVVPEHLRRSVLHQLHDAPTAGHLGLTRTYDRVRRRFFWPSLYRSVRRYVSSCDACQRRKKLTTAPAGPLQPLDVPSEPFYRVGMDLLGPFPFSTSGNKWIAVATDYATRFAITRALPTSCATDVADFLLHDVILHHGAPRQLLTDRGRYFLSKVIADLLRLSSTTHKLTTSYHPQTNGLTERFNRTLTDMLSMYVSADHKDWDLTLPYVTFAYNSSRHDTAGFSPFYLLYGREPTLPLDTLMPSSTTPPTEYAFEAISRATLAREVARARLSASQASQKTRYDLKHRDVYYPPGTLVLLWSPSRRVGLSEKLLSPYHGPYKVLRQVTDVTYEITPVAASTSSSPPKTDIVHVLRLKPYNSPSLDATP